MEAAPSDRAAARELKPTKSALQGAVVHNAKPDEFGVTHHEIIFSEKDNKIWCIIDAPNKDAVEKHHKKANVEADFIFEVESTR